MGLHSRLYCLSPCEIERYNFYSNLYRGKSCDPLYSYKISTYNEITNLKVSNYSFSLHWGMNDKNKTANVLLHWAGCLLFHLKRLYPCHSSFLHFPTYPPLLNLSPREITTQLGSVTQRRRRGREHHEGPKPTKRGRRV